MKKVTTETTGEHNHEKPDNHDHEQDGILGKNTKL